MVKVLSSLTRLDEPVSLEWWFLFSREEDQRVRSNNRGLIILSLSGKVETKVVNGEVACRAGYTPDHLKPDLGLNLA